MSLGRHAHEDIFRQQRDRVEVDAGRERALGDELIGRAAGIAEQIAQLDNLAIDTRERTSSDRVRTVMITDLDGNHIAFAEPIDQRVAR